METNYGYRRRLYVGEPKIKSINFFLSALLWLMKRPNGQLPFVLIDKVFVDEEKKVLVFAFQQQLVSFNTHSQLSIRMRVSNH